MTKPPDFSKFERNRWPETLFRWLCFAAVILPLLLLLGLVIDVIMDGVPRIDWDFITSYPSRHASKAGILPGIVGSLYLIALAMALALPIGVAAAIYLEEYVDTTHPTKRWIARIVEINIGNLAGVPTVIYGLLGLEVFARTLGLGRSLIAGAATMALLIVPMVIMTARESLRNVPHSLREAGLALGATKWQTLYKVILPMAFPGIITGAILAVARAMGEAAPLIVLGAVTYIAFLPDGIDSPFTVLPIQIFNWVSRPQAEFAINAAAGIVILVGALCVFNGAATFLRMYYEKRSK